MRIVLFILPKTHINRKHLYRDFYSFIYIAAEAAMKEYVDSVYSVPFFVSKK